jgi:hypothetical protein
MSANSKDGAIDPRRLSTNNPFDPLQPQQQQQQHHHHAALHLPVMTAATPMQPIAPATTTSIPYFTALRFSAPLPLSSIPTLETRSYTHTPDVFSHCKLRSGKWIPEEEQYALLVIQLFEKGRIAACENGCTLRSYMSQKLHCAPMRISKKFAGKGIGKMVFCSKLNAPATTAQQEKEHQDLTQRARAAQEKFYQAVFPQENTMAVRTVVRCSCLYNVWF